MCWTEYSEIWEVTSWTLKYKHSQVQRKLAMTMDTVIRVVLLNDWGEVK